MLVSLPFLRPKEAPKQWPLMVPFVTVAWELCTFSGTQILTLLFRLSVLSRWFVSRVSRLLDF